MLGWEYFRIWQREVGKDCKKKEKKSRSCYGKAIGQCWDTLWRKVYKKCVQILNDRTHSVRHYFDSRRTNRSGRFVLPKANTNSNIALFYLRLCQLLIKIMIVTEYLCAVHQDIYWEWWISKTFKGEEGGGGGGGRGLMYVPYDFTWAVLFWSVRCNIIPGQFGFVRY